MTNEQLKELKIKTLEAYGYSLEKDNNGVDEFYRLWDSKGQRYLGVNFDSRTEAWDAAPDVTRSLDACAPLIEEMTGYEGCGHLDIIYHTPISVSVTVGLVEEGDIEEWVHDVPNPAATALCLAYCKFKELTKEVSTKGEEHA